MVYNELGRSGLKVSELAMGGTTATGKYGSEEQHREFRAGIERAVELGINLFDTAESYGDGESERLVGEALKPVRDRVLIASKVAFRNLKRDDAKRACENSLQRLQTDRIDVYFIHRPNPEVRVEETMEALVELKERGLIKAIGLSNFTRADMEKAMAVGRYDVIQPCYNLLWRNIEKAIVPYCVEHKISIVPYSPLVQGILAGKFGRDLSLDSIDTRSRILLFQKEWYGKCLDVVDGMRPIAKKHGKSLAQVAINWVQAQRGITSVIIGGRSPKQVEENVGAAGWKLTRGDLATLDQISRVVTDKLPDQPSFWFKSYRPREIRARPERSICVSPRADRAVVARPAASLPMDLCAGVASTAEVDSDRRQCVRSGYRRRRFTSASPDSAATRRNTGRLSPGRLHGWPFPALSCLQV